MDVMEPVVEDREDLLRNEVIQLFGKYYLKRPANDARTKGSLQIPVVFTVCKSK